ncbi:homeobox-DDT domain protein RLT1-like [Andrographis paniculata]|uniref:homeobox-DDT domain protein RLT1-like n=1 Tax=Andrographis paniculata TaxID=175694 RepID=UPI0021E8051D|nr:homeobox-DDT domain protein RLT1-like [Andrographis paniculata]
MKQDSPEMDSNDGRALPENNKKRSVKTRAQIDALENFYNEHKYPTEAMKAQLAESIGLTQKQVSGWFCHRRSKDKWSAAPGKQPGSQDIGVGHKQDSCGSTKQGGGDPKEFSATELTYEQGNRYPQNDNYTTDPSSDSSFSLRNVSSHQNGELLDGGVSSYVVTKNSPVGMRRPGPSGYLKVKSRVEDPSISAVKRQLGEHYRSDGPQLGVQFDPLPPRAFETAMDGAVKGEAVVPTSKDVTDTFHSPIISNANRYNSSSASYNYNTRHGYDTHDGYANHMIRPSTYLPNNELYNHPRRNSSVEWPENPDRDKYKMKPRPGVEAARINSFPSHPHQQPHNKKIKNGNLKPRNKRKELCSSEDGGLPRQTIKDAETYSDGWILDESRVKNPFANNFSVVQKPAFFGSLPMAQMPSSFSEDEESAETSSSVD